MISVLVAVGIALIIFGAVVLIRYADRPGATLKWLGMELSSAGAGLPLVGIGVGCILFAVLQGSGASSSEPPVDVSSTAPAGGANPGGSVPVQPARSVTDPDDCLAAFVAPLPEDRVARVEVGMRDLEVIGRHQPLEQPFGIVLTENGEEIGAIRLRLYRAGNSSADLYKIEAIVDAACEPVGQLRNASRGGNPYELVNWDTVRMRLGAHEYELRLGGEGDISVGRLDRVS